MKMTVLVSLLLFIGGVFGAAGFFWWRFLNTPASSAAAEIVYEVKPGQTLSRVARDLEAKGLITRANWFLLMARLQGRQNEMKVGEYALSGHLKPSEVLDVITSGRSVGRNFTVSEGLNLFEIADLYERVVPGGRKEFWKLVNDPEFASGLLGERVSSLEGYLYPETYQITKYTDTKSVLRAMVARFMDVYRREVQPLAEGSGMNRHQIVTLASIIEKETGAPEERSLISSVFHNRLKKGMMLQTDPTVLYGKARQLGKMEIKISRQDLSAPTEYNTYVIKGLPPGPIANPGQAALVAALKPENSEFLFFVSQNDGTHIFSKTYEAHRSAVEAFQIDPKSREGRSWRELQKKRFDQNLQKDSRQPAPGR